MKNIIRSSSNAFIELENISEDNTITLDLHTTIELKSDIELANIYAIVDNYVKKLKTMRIKHDGDCELVVE